MARLSLVIVSLCCSVAVSSVHQYPQATSYVYRSDHGGPANYINVGPKDEGSFYRQPQVFAAPIPVVAHPLYAKAEPIALEEVHEAAEYDDSGDHEEDAADDYDGDDDQDGDEEEEEEDSHEHGGGNAYGAAHHSDHGEAGNKGYESQYGFHKGEAGSNGADNHKGFYSKGAGHEDKHYDEADAYGENYGASKGHKGEDFGSKKGHSKGEETTGFHKVYRNDEFKKDHVFYDKADNSGHFNKHASGDSQHHSAAGGHKKGGHYDSAHNEGGFGKAGHSYNGRHHDAGKGYAGKGGDESYYSHHGDYAGKGGHAKGKEFGYGHDH